jgi:hypothetical protein
VGVFCIANKIEVMVLKLSVSAVMLRWEGAAMSHVVGKERALERNLHITRYMKFYLSPALSIRSV